MPVCACFGVLLSAVYWLTLPPGVTFEDTGLFATVCYNAGIAHPPVILYTRFFAFRLPALPIFYRSIRHKQRRFYHRWPPLPPPFCFMKSPDGCGGDELGVFFSCGLGPWRPFWSQAIIPETYTLNALLVVATYSLFCVSCAARKNVNRFLSPLFYSGWVFPITGRYI